MAGTATLAAAWIIGVALGGPPHLKAGAPLALEILNSSAPRDRFADAADAFGPAFAGTAAAQVANEAAKGPKFAVAYPGSKPEPERQEITASLPAASATASPRPAKRLAERANDRSSPPPRQIERQQAAASRETSAAPTRPAQPAAPQVAIASASATLPVFNLFDPEPMYTGSLAYAPGDAHDLVPNPAAERAIHAAASPRTPEGRQGATARDTIATQQKPALPQVASAEPTEATPFNFFKRLLSPPSRTAPDWLPGTDGHTAIYDIEAHTVYLPNGEKLEAHSGLGSRIDDPRYVGEKARGPTPPNVYELTMRGDLFHGVKAIRLNPVGDSKMFGRDGILAHTYMLGPSGQSFGCVSFKDYAEFLRAFERGEVNRIVVVPHLDARASNDGNDRHAMPAGRAAPSDDRGV